MESIVTRAFHFLANSMRRPHGESFSCVEANRRDKTDDEDASLPDTFLSVVGLQ